MQNRKNKLGKPRSPTLFPTPLGPYELVEADAFAWLSQAKPCSVHAVVTDPPYGLIEYTPGELEKRRHGRGGVWRIPPTFDGCSRSPLPRFTVLTENHRADLRSFFQRFAELLLPVLVPGAHVFIATNPFMGSGSTIAAAAACNLSSIGIEINPDYFRVAAQSVPCLAEYLPPQAITKRRRDRMSPMGRLPLV